MTDESFIPICRSGPRAATQSFRPLVIRTSVAVERPLLRLTLYPTIHPGVQQVQRQWAFLENDAVKVANIELVAKPVLGPGF